MTVQLVLLKCSPNPRGFALVLADFVGGKVLKLLQMVRPDLKRATTGTSSNEIMTSVPGSNVSQTAIH